MELELETKASEPAPFPTCHTALTPVQRHTPAEADKPPEVLPLWEEGDDKQRVKIEAFHQQPGVVGHDAVLEEDHDQLTACLDRER